MSSSATPPSKLFGTISARLTTWGACVTLAVCALLSMVLYAGLRTSMRSEIDSFLQGEVHEFMVTVNDHLGDDAGLQRSIREELGSRAHKDLAFRLFDANEKLLVSSETNDAVAALWLLPDGWTDNEPRLLFQTVTPTKTGSAYRTCSLRVTTNDGRPCTAQASYTLDRMYASLTTFRHACAIGLGLAAVLSILCGRVLARRSLRPLQALAEKADGIGASNLSERIALSGTGDELDRLGATLNHMLGRIEHHVQRVQQFTADASHELRSPLAALRGSAEVALSKTRSTDELRQVLEESIEHFDRLSQIAEDLLLLARADAGQKIASTELVRLDDAVVSVVDLYTPLAQDHDIDLVMKSQEPSVLHGDGARLRQLVGNLLDNAIKFSHSGDRITISVTNQNGLARVTVADSGAGIAQEHLPHVFDRFYQADQSRSTRNRGSGLGLPICRAIAESHGGTIHVTSPPGQGTRVTVRLPVSDVARESREPRTAPGHAGPGQPD